jgi:hypothetical protein
MAGEEKVQSKGMADLGSRHKKRAGLYRGDEPSTSPHLKRYPNFSHAQQKKQK